jgi:integrase
VAGSARPWISWRSGGHLASCRKGLSRTSQNKCGQNGSKLRRSPTHRRLLYEAAFLTGLRASELRRLTLEHLDLEHSGLQLESEWTKNRKSCFQPLPKDLANKLYEFARSEEPSRLYAKFHKRKHHTATMPKQPLLYVPSHTARSVDQDLLSAGLQSMDLAARSTFTPSAKHTSIWSSKAASPSKKPKPSLDTRHPN